MEQILQNTAAAVIPPIAMTDGELLMQYARHGDETAFAELVRKHGRLVWTVCWQVLREHHEIEDAFQSTFFILAKRAGSIRSYDSLCGWLYQVAYRTALRARMATRRRPLNELAVDDVGDLDDKLRAIEQHDERAVLLEELHALPEQYQQVLILCYLEGKPRRKIADELGCSLETIKGRLARGRQVLRHRLIRRGVSLSLAMGAMAVPAKAASTAVTPKLIGLTVAGSSAWLSGTAKFTSTVSAQAIQLAQQGTVAMTISSFAKPLVLGAALLGAATATLAVDSSEKSPAVQPINLQAVNEGELTSVSGDDAAVELTVAEDESSEPANKEQPARNATVTITGPAKVIELEPLPSLPQPPRTISEDAEERLGLAGDPQPIRTDVTVPANVYMPPDVRVPYPVRPVDIFVGDPVSVKRQLVIAESMAKIAQLQLESKELEIEAFDAAVAEEKENLLEESRKKLAMAEAEKLRMQVESQRAQIEALKQQIEKQAKQIGKEAAARVKSQVLTEADLAKAHARQAAVQAAQAAAQAERLRIQERSVLVDPLPGQPLAPNVVLPPPTWEQSTEAQQGALSLQPGDQIKIDAIDVFPDRPINGIFVVEPMGTVALGASYGRAQVAGLSVIEAEKSIKKQLSEILQNPEVQVTFVGRGRVQPPVSTTSPVIEDEPSHFGPGKTEDAPFKGL